MRVIKVRSVYSIHSQWKSKRMLAIYIDTCVITSWRLGLRAPLVTRNYFGKFLSAYFLIREIYNLSLMSVICSTVKSIQLTLNSRSSRELSIESSRLLHLDSRFLRDSTNWNSLLFTIDYKGFCFECNLLTLLSILDCCENLTTLVQVLATSLLLSYQKNFSTV